MLNKEENSKFEAQAAELVALTKGKDERSKTYIIRKLLPSHNTEVSPKYLAYIIKVCGITHENYKACIVSELISKSNTSVNAKYVVDLLREIGSESQNIKHNIIIEFLSTCNTIVTKEDVAYIVKACGITSEHIKDNIIIAFLLHNSKYKFKLSNTENKLKMINEVIAEYGMQYNAIVVINIYKQCIFNRNDIVPHLLDALKDLYPNSSSAQTDCLGQAINEYIINQSNFPLLGLEKNNSHFETGDLFKLLQYSKERNIFPKGVNSNITILSIVKNRFGTKYSSLTEILKGKKWEECLTDNGYKMIKAEFRKTLSKDITLLDLISYYDVCNKMPSLSEHLTQNIRKEIISKFKPSKDKLFISSEELKKVNELVQCNAQGSFIPVKNLCDYFLETINLTPPQAENFKINFVNSPFEEIRTDKQSIAKYKQEKRQEISKIFKDVLFKQDTGPIDPIVEMAIIHLADSMNDPAIKEVITKHAGVLQVFFKNSKSNLAILLSQEGGLAMFQDALVTLSHGCAANIGSQITLILYSALLSKQDTNEKVANVNEGIIFLALNRGIVDIINSSYRDIIGSNINPLLNKKIRSYYFSPDALFKAISETYVDKKGEIISDPWETMLYSILKVKLSSNSVEHDKGESAKLLRGQILEELSYETNNNFNRDTADIATYLLLESNNPLLSSKLADCFEYKKAEKIVNDADVKVCLQKQLTSQDKPVSEKQQQIDMTNLTSTSNQSQSSRRLSKNISSLLYETQRVQTGEDVVIHERTSEFFRQKIWTVRL